MGPQIYWGHDHDLWGSRDVIDHVTIGLGVGTFLLAGFSIDLNFQDVMTSKLKNLDVSVQNLEVMQ